MQMFQDNYKNTSALSHIAPTINLHLRKSYYKDIAFMWYDNSGGIISVKGGRFFKPWVLYARTQVCL